MSPTPLSLRRALRAEFPEPRCAYCHSPEQLLGMPLEVDHIIPEAASGKTELANVCVAVPVTAIRGGVSMPVIPRREGRCGYFIRADNNGEDTLPGVQTECASSG